MRPLQVYTLVGVIVFSVTILYHLVTREGDVIVSGPIPGSSRIPGTKTGLKYDLKQAHHSGSVRRISDDNFGVEGFKFYTKLPKVVNKITHNFRPVNSWLLHGRNAVGNVTLKEVQREQSQLEAVVVVVKYYTTWNWTPSSSVTVMGRTVNRDTDEILEESEILPDISAGETPERGGYCQKIVYLGTVDEVIVSGNIKNTDDAVVLIDNIQVVVGQSEFDSMLDLICNKKKDKE